MLEILFNFNVFCLNNSTLFLFSGLQEELYENLKKIKHLTVYRKQDIPEKFHYKHNRRVPPILIAADEGYSLCDANHLPCQEIGTVTVTYH